jgi:uncharacterized protein (DUF697 family)
LARLPIKPTAVFQVAREVKTAAGNAKPILLSGEAVVVGEIAEALGAGGDPSCVRALPGRTPGASSLEDAELLVHVVAGGTPGPDEEEVFRVADRRQVPVLCVLAGADDPDAALAVPYVLATDVVAFRPGEPAPIEGILDEIASRLGDKGYALAAKLPAIRRGVCEHIVTTFARQNGILGVVIFIPGADMPALTLNQIRMVLRIGGAYGAEVDRERALEILGVVGAGLGFRAIARELVSLVPFGGFAIKGAVAFAGTRAVGEAAIAYFEAGGAEALAGSVRSRS